MIYTATMWTLPPAAQGLGDRQDWIRTIMRGPAADEADFKRLCEAQQAPGTLIAFGPITVKHS